VGSDTARDKLPAIFMSVPNSSTIVGINSSPPATPMMAATTPMRNPATTPETRTAAGASTTWCNVPTWLAISAAAMSTSMAARTR
jgi:hypothetical protein